MVSTLTLFTSSHLGDNFLVPFTPVHILFICFGTSSLAQCYACHVGVTVKPRMLMPSIMLSYKFFDAIIESFVTTGYISSLV